MSSEDAIDKHKDHSSITQILGRFGHKCNTFSFKPVSSVAVKKKLKSINIRKATGFDNIPGKLLRIVHNELSGPLANLINNCMSQNVFPECMKCAELSPIFKKNDNLVKDNFRPVSILTTLSKIYELEMNDQMVDHFIYIFDHLLSAFRKGYSCQSILIKCIDDWKVALDENKIVGALFMDLSKAFDCLPHSLLISKLNAYGFDINACELVSSYLSDRKQRVKLGNVRSDWNYLTKGVPQGSILGPLLFNVFMNDLFYFIEKCALYNYADDTSLSNCSFDTQDVVTNLQHDGNIAINWFTDNGMQANPDKFQFMVFSRAQLGEQTIILDGNTVIKSEPFVKALGVYIDENLSFSKHVSEICKKAAKQLNALARISRYLDESSLSIIYRCFILSNFSYCPLVWHFCGTSNNNKLEKIQERSLRILFKDYDSTYHTLLENAKESTALMSRICGIAIHVFKCLKNMNPTPLNDMFETKVALYSMRNPNKLNQPKRRTTNYGIRSLSYIGSKIWNDLPFSLDINSLELDEFKTLLNTWDGPDFSISVCPYL